MYEQVFNLNSRPFTSSPYVKHYYPAEAIEQSLQQCKMTIDRGSGPVVVVGDHGTGKSLLLAMLEDQYRTQYRVVNISVAFMRGRADLLQNILFELKLNYRGLDESEMRLELLEFFKSDPSGNGGVLLLVDDAQKLSRETIEELLVFSNCVVDGQPRVRLVLAGSRGLEERLADASLEAFNQRIAGRCFLTCLSGEEIESYVKAHLTRSGGDPAALFAEDAYRAIREVSEGRPRYINQVCDHAMIFSATRGETPVTDSMVREAWFDIQQLPGSVAPSGSGASSSDTPIVSQTSTVEGSDGWTVLEFGDLSAEASEENSESEGAIALEIVEAPDDSAADVPEEFSQAESTTYEEQSVEEFVVTEVEEPQEPASIPVEMNTADESADIAATAVPEAFGGAAILASAMAGFGVSLETEPAQETAFVQETEPVQEPASTQESESTEQEILVAGPPPADDDFPTVSEDADVSSLTTTFETQPTVVATDPFADDEFENEEVLTDAYSPFVAQQNQRSLDVTSDLLQNLTPADQVSPEPSSDEVADAAAEEESFPTSESALQPPEPVRQPIRPSYDRRDYQETREESAWLGIDSLSDDFDVNHEAASIVPQDETGAISMEVPFSPESIDVNPGLEFVPLDPDAPAVEAASVEESQPEPLFESQPEPQVEPQSEKVDPGFHEQASNPDDPEIRQQALDIIRSLGVDVGRETVSHETPAASIEVQQETNAIEDTILRSIQAREATVETPVDQPAPVLMPEIERIQQSLQAAQSAHGLAEIPVSNPVPVQVSGEDPLEADQQVLEEINAQSEMLSEVQADDSMTLQYPQQPNAGQDDRDILEVQQEFPVQASTEPASEAELPEWSQQEPSQGEAARVDYHQLFDQLRNIQTPEQ
jgi:type II secretory pathway predicted ATPase ExeA